MAHSLCVLQIRIHSQLIVTHVLDTFFFAVSYRNIVILFVFGGYNIPFCSTVRHLNLAFDSSYFQDCFGSKSANYFISDIAGKEMVT